jgi:hypothetical protein
MSYRVTVTVPESLLGSDCHSIISSLQHNQEKPENRGAGLARTPVFGEPFVKYY